MKKFFKNFGLILVAVFILFINSVAIARADSGSQDFAFCFAFNGDYARTDTRNKTDSDMISMQCTFAESPYASYIAWPIYNEEIYTNNRYVFSEGTWHAINYTGPINVGVYMEGCLIDDYGYDGHIFEGYWYVDSGIY
ncbi:MAG: hypothetical protein ACI4D4_01480 [Lachnospira sp.]